MGWTSDRRVWGVAVVLGMLLAAGTGLAAAKAPPGLPPAATCSPRTLTGSYATHGTGEVLGAPFALVGQLAFDGDGQVSGRLSETKLLVGNVERTALTGTYELDGSCAGEMAIRVEHEDWVDHHRFDLYVADGGRRFHWILTSTWFDHLDVGGLHLDVDPEGLNEALLGATTSDRHGGALSGVAERA